MQDIFDLMQSEPTENEPTKKEPTENEPEAVKLSRADMVLLCKYAIMEVKSDLEFFIKKGWFDYVKRDRGTIATFEKVLKAVDAGSGIDII